MNPNATAGANPDALAARRIEGNEVRVANGVGAVNPNPSSSARVVHGAGYMQAYQQAQLSQNAAMAANQAVANARAMNGFQAGIRGNPMQVMSGARTYGAGVTGYPSRVVNVPTPQGQKRAFPASSPPYAAGNGRTSNALNHVGGTGTPQKFLRTPNGRAVTNNYKNHLHAQDAMSRYKAAYNNAGPALVNIVENAAAYFEGKDTPEAIKDKERSFERYTFNADLLSEIFEGPLPQPEAETDKSDDDGKEGNSKPVSGQEALRVVLKKNLLSEIGGQMMTRSYDERMSELDALSTRYAALESEQQQNKSSMRLFQKVDRATSIEELRRVRAEYEKAFGVQFVEHPPLFEKRELDRSLDALVERCPTPKIIQL